MASNQTGNYGLNQWEATDQVLRTEFNADNSKIDAALKALADKEAELEGTLAGQAADIAKCGTCKYECFSYNGTGATTTITFSHKPLFFIVLGTLGLLFANTQSGKAASVIQGTNVYFGRLTLTWNENQVTVTGGNALYTLNEMGQTYWVFALYQEV